MLLFRSESLYKISSYFVTLHSINLIVWLLTTIETNSLIGGIKMCKRNSGRGKSKVMSTKVPCKENRHCYKKVRKGELKALNNH
jgi:hypothetical protein